MIIQREQYLKKLRQVKDKPLIKVLTGVRRCGKSVLMAQFRDELIKNGVGESNTQFLNFEEAENGAYSKTWQEIHDSIAQRLVKGTKNYIFLDEIQNVSEWEKLVDSLYAKDNVDLYLTGSNAYLLSSELATLLSGRQFEIRVLPFSFSEYAELTGDNTEAGLLKYLRFGGMPQAVDFINDESLATDYLNGVFNTVVIKDMISRGQIKDTELLTRIMIYAFDNIGNPFSAKKVADYLCSNYRQVSSQTVEKYLSAASEAFIMYPAQRFNIRGKELLKTNCKYYIVDMGFRNILLARGEAFDIGRAIENTVYLELIRRGYQTFVGQTKNSKEVDFVAKTRDGDYVYIQVCETMRGEETRNRELTALKDVPDNHPKIILSLDPEENNFGGIRQVNLRKWLLEE